MLGWEQTSPDILGGFALSGLSLSSSDGGVGELRMWDSALPVCEFPLLSGDCSDESHSFVHKAITEPALCKTMLSATQDVCSPDNVGILLIDPF